MLSPAVALVAVVLSAFQQSDSTLTPAGAAVAVRAEQAPRIDGRDDDAVWQNAPRYSAFREFQPKVDIDPRLKTEFRAAYDDRDLYVFVRTFDPHPDSIR